MERLVHILQNICSRGTHVQKKQPEAWMLMKYRVKLHITPLEGFTIWTQTSQTFDLTSDQEQLPNN